MTVRLPPDLRLEAFAIAEMRLRDCLAGFSDALEAVERGDPMARAALQRAQLETRTAIVELDRLVTGSAADLT